MIENTLKQSKESNHEPTIHTAATITRFLQKLSTATILKLADCTEINEDFDFKLMVGYFPYSAELKSSN